MQMDPEAIRERMRERLPAQAMDWLTLAGNLASASGAHAYLVGGPVRDLFLTTITRGHDLDVSVEGDAIDIAEKFARQVRGAIVSHGRFGTATIVVREGDRIDLATSRREVYEEPAALPQVQSASIKDDLYRRDFSINAMAIDVTSLQFGGLIDPHQGLSDIDSHLIRVLHSNSFIDDPTRIFRAIRFACRFGFTIEPQTLHWLQDAVRERMIPRLSGERIRQEIQNALSEESVLEVMQQLESYGVWQDIGLHFDEESLRIATLLKRRFNMPWNGMLQALTIELPVSAVEQLAVRIQLDTQSRMILLSAASAPSIERLLEDASLSPSKLQRALAGVPEETLKLIVARSPYLEAGLNNYLGQIRRGRADINGDDLRAAGYEPSAAFSDALDAAFDAKLNGSSREDQMKAAVSVLRQDQKRGER